MGLPFGIQVIGPNGSDARVLQIAHALQQVVNKNEATSRPVPNVCPLATFDYRTPWENYAASQQAT
jgi:amidase